MSERAKTIGLITDILQQMPARELRWVYLFVYNLTHQEERDPITEVIE